MMELLLTTSLLVANMMRVFKDS